MRYTLSTVDDITDYLKTLSNQRQTLLQHKGYSSILLQLHLRFGFSPAYLEIVAWSLEPTLILLVMYGRLQFGIQYPFAYVCSASSAQVMFWYTGYSFLPYHRILDRA